MRHLWLVSALVLGGAPTLAWAQATLLYQGQVFGAHGPVNAAYNMTFRLYEAAEGGDSVWTESFENVPVVDGVFLVELGAREPLADIAQRASPLYLGISLAENAEMQPRMLVGTALRAQWAAHAKDVAGEDIHPRTLSIGERLVIDETGQWLGEQMSAQGPRGPAGPSGADFDVRADADDDGFPDWLEIIAGSDPHDADDQIADENNDGVPDVLQGPPGASGMPGPRGPTGADGLAGPPGSAGTPGPPGATGARGPTGPAGERGEPGPSGPPGAAGARGETGEKGEVGQMGPIGPVGPGGPTGPRGTAGPAGPAGPEGPVGPRGLQGVEGLSGPQGPVGPRGPAGEAGIAGLKGDKGDSGSAGPQGERGIQGPRGEQGEIGPLGPQGPRGPQGETGPVGPLGPQGPRGLQGDPGERGPMGPEGQRGPAGELGPMGVMGPRGPEGAKGERGDLGLMGPAGPKGANGDPGPIGPQGLQGPQGLTGAIGPKGDRGEKGDRGDPGPAGPMGLSGAIGPQGPQGAQGEPGERGPIGPTGFTGATGDRGPEGPRGEKGDRGDIGPQGLPGGAGPQGPQGPVGPSGLAGPAGPQGVAGASGPQGATGSVGPAGPTGATGEVGYPSMVSSIHEPAGSNCVSGGRLLRYGIDVNRDGVLAATEITSSDFVCHGDTGADGVPGVIGAQGPRGERGYSTLVQTLIEPAGVNCANGGVWVRHGLDQDGDGSLHIDEVNAGHFVCNGAQGVQGIPGDVGAKGDQGDKGDEGPMGPVGTKGDPGSKGDTGPKGDKGETGATGENGLSTLASTQTEPAGSNCPTGGTKILYGRDLNRDTVLDAVEVENSYFVCAGPVGEKGEQGIQGVPAPNATWPDLLERPADLVDGDDDSLAALNCTDGQVPVYSASVGVWQCGQDQNTQLSTSDIRNAVESITSLSFQSGVRVDGSPVITETGLTWSKVQNVPNGLDDGDDDTLASMTCGGGQIPRYDATSASWLCGTAPDTKLSESDVLAMVGAAQNLNLAASTTLGGNEVLTSASTLTVPWSQISNRPAGLDDGDNDADTLGALSCADGEVAMQGPGGWECKPPMSGEFLTDKAFRYVDTIGSTSRGTLVFSKQVTSSVSGGVLATITNFGSTTMVVAKVTWVGIYAWAGTGLGGGLCLAMTRRSNSDTTWTDNNDNWIWFEQANGVAKPTVYWDNGVLKYDYGGSQEGEIQVEITWRSATITPNI